VKQQVEKVATQRLSLCKGCAHNSDNKKRSGYKSFRPDVHCTICGCNLELKTRCMSCECPIKKWTPVLSESEEKQLDEKLNANDSQGE
jgi:hypothetical protein